MDYSVFNAMKFPVCVIGSNGELHFRNEYFKELVKDDETSSLSLDVEHPLYSEYRKRIALSYHKALSGNDTKLFAVMKGADGRQFPAEIYLFPMKMENEMPGILALFKQVDDRMASFDSSLDSDTAGVCENTNIFEFSPFPIVRIEQDNSISAMSASVEMITGCTKNDLMDDNSKFYTVFTTYDSERLKSAIRDIFAGYVSFKRINELRINTYKKEERFANAVVYPVIADKRIVSAEILFEDITKISYLEKRISSMNRGQIIGDMTEGILHSFSNFINVVISRSEMIMQITEKGTVLEGLQVIYKASQNAAKQIKRLQEFMSTEESDDDRTEPVDILELIEDAIEFSKMQFNAESRSRNKNIKIIKQFYAKGEIVCNLRLMREIIVSMILRIASYIGWDGDVKVEIRHTNDLIFSVIAEKKDPQVHLQEDFATDIEIRRLADRAKVRILEEESGNQICIKGIIPARLMSKQVVENDKQTVSKLRDLDILIVEDEKALSEILFELFDSMGNRVTISENGLNGLEEFKKSTFDIVISDYGIPGLTGIELLAKIKEIEPRTITVLLSGWNLGNIKSYENIINLYLSKPFQIDQLLLEISKIEIPEKK